MPRLIIQFKVAHNDVWLPESNEVLLETTDALKKAYKYLVKGCSHNRVRQAMIYDEENKLTHHLKTPNFYASKVSWAKTGIAFSTRHNLLCDNPDEHIFYTN